MNDIHKTTKVVLVNTNKVNHEFLDDTAQIYYGCSISSRFHHLYLNIRCQPNLNASFKYTLIDVLINTTKFIQLRLFVYT